MILFKPEHAPMILAGRKTQTRRLGKRRWNVGAVHQCATRLFDRGAVFAKVRIVSVTRSVLWDMTLEDALAEGYASQVDFADAFERINGPVAFDTPVWVVEFELVEAVAA